MTTGGRGRPLEVPRPSRSLPTLAEYWPTCATAAGTGDRQDRQAPWTARAGKSPDRQGHIDEYTLASPDTLGAQALCEST